MTDKEKLIELIRKAKKNTKGANCDLEREMLFADFLLANGVIVPPCKVGDTVYCIQPYYDHDRKKYKTIIKPRVVDFVFTMPFMAESNGMILKERDFGKTVFLTKEEAEQFLKGGNNNA